MDNNGNQIKDRCREAWQQNSDGQKHGKYIEYHENGNPYLVQYFNNGIKNGSIKEFDLNGATIVLSGTYVNGLRGGTWRLQNESGSYVKGVKTGVWTYSIASQHKLEFNHTSKIFSFKWNLLAIDGNIKDGLLNGKVLFKFYMKKVGTKGLYSNEGVYCLLPEVNGHRANIFDGFYSVDTEYFVSQDISIKEKQIVTLNGETELRYPVFIPQGVANSIIAHLKKIGDVSSLNIILQYESGQLDSNYEISVYDDQGKKLNTFKINEL